MSDTKKRVQGDTTVRFRDRRSRWLIPFAGIIALIGYFGPWVPHVASGLTVTGLDLGEFVKFLPAVRNGEIGVWREGFYLPLIAISVSFSLLVFRPELAYDRITRCAPTCCIRYRRAESAASCMDTFPVDDLRVPRANGLPDSLLDAHTL